MRRKKERQILLVYFVLISMLLIYFGFVFFLTKDSYKIQSISLFDHGKFNSLNVTYFEKILLPIAKQVNLHAKCAIFDEEVNKLKREGKLIEVVFKEPINLSFNKNVKKILFVLEGNYKGNILFKSVNYVGYDCWAIKSQFNNEIDRSWIKNIEKALKNFSDKVIYKVDNCFVRHKPRETISYDENTKTLIAYVWVNCCGVEVKVEKEGLTYKILEKQYGEICRCMCKRKVTIFNVPKEARVEFLDKDGNYFILSPNINFCGWSTYGKCNTDADCIIDGCSNQVCRSKFEEQAITSCEWLDCYNASKYNVACKCINGKCQWVRK